MIEYLDRTIRLIRDVVRDEASDEDLFTALTDTRVVLVVDETTLRRHSARVALATTAQLAARSGAQVFIKAPNVRLSSPVPPARSETLADALLELGSELLPGNHLRMGVPKCGADVVVLLGPAPWRRDGELVFRLTAGDSDGRIGRLSRTEPWQGEEWPLGGLAAAGLAAAEVFKASVRKLRRFARDSMFDELFAPVTTARLAFEGARPVPANLGAFDVVSAGAISQALLFCLAQIPGVGGNARVIEGERSEASNMNRYMLLLRSELGRPKADSLARLPLAGLRVESVPMRLDEASLGILTPLANRVLVGVDHIPSRWFAQAQWPTWLGVGATSHFGAMSSWHAAGAGCAHCLHPRDEATGGPIPTVAFVSFLAGLSLAARFIGEVSGLRGDPSQQQEWLSTLRLDAGSWRTPVAMRSDCPLGCGSRAKRAA